MQDYLGTNLEIGDYIFGGDASQLFIITDIGPDGFAMATTLGSRTARKIFLYNFVKISKEQLTLYFMEKGYRT